MSVWVLLRGLSRERGHWSDFPALLQRRLHDSTVVTLDLPGNGELNRFASPTRIESMTQWYREELRRLGLEPPYRLLAMSMGAMIAVDWAHREPQALAGCVLVNTSLRPFNPWFRRLRPTSYPALLRLALPGSSDEARERMILRLTSRNGEVAIRSLDTWVQLRRARPVSTRNALRQLIAAARFRSPEAAPDVPLLVLARGRDALVDVRCSQHLAARWRADIAIHDQAGHDLPLDDGEWVTERIARWLDPSRP